MVALRLSKMRKIGYWEKLWLSLLLNSGFPGDKSLPGLKSHFWTAL